MSSKIFKAIWAVAMIIFLASLILILGVSYNYFSAVQKKQLRIETDLAAQGVALSGEKYFDQLKADDYRITWVSSDGHVLFDNEADAAEMQNHLEREEIREAIEEGFGEATRHSYTLADQQFYAAKLLSDGTILRLSISQLSVWTLIFGFAPPISFILLLALVLSFVLASRIAKVIVKPINDIDLSHPEQYYEKDDYKEIEPLLRHISDQHQQLKSDQADIERAALIRQEFSANVSHELKTPLHAISGYAELIENGLVREEDIKPFATKIREESSRMTKLVEDIIDLTRLDQGGSEMIWENCDLYLIAENAVESLDNAASGKGIEIRTEGVSSPMTAIPHMLYSIVYNLCDNAVKYSNPGGSVRVSVSPEGQETILTVSDNGFGIPKESLDRIFERFYRVDKSHSKDVGGTGLGLSIVKHAVNIHRGDIKVQSKTGEGTTFIVTLPNEKGEEIIDGNQ